MKILLTEEEVMNVVSSLSEEDIKHYSAGKWNRWVGKKTERQDYEFDCKYDANGNVKPSQLTENIKEKKQ